MWILYKDDKESFIEVKYSKDLEPKSKKYERTIKQINVQNSWCKVRNIDSKVKTEKEIRGNQILLSNMKMLIPYTKNGLQLNGTDHKMIVDCIKQFNIITVCLLEEYLPDIPSQRLKESLCCMLYLGTIYGNLDKIPYSKKTEVWFNDDKTYHGKYNNR